MPLLSWNIGMELLEDMLLAVDIMFISHNQKDFTGINIILIDLSIISKMGIDTKLIMFLYLKCV